MVNQKESWFDKHHQQKAEIDKMAGKYAKYGVRIEQEHIVIPRPDGRESFILKAKFIPTDNGEMSIENYIKMILTEDGIELDSTAIDSDEEDRAMPLAA